MALCIQVQIFFIIHPDAERGKRTHVVVTASIMHHFRKKSSSAATPTVNAPPPAPTPPIVEYTKQELATLHPWAKDRRALAASSSALTDSALYEPGSSKESVWKAAYGAARMAVDIAKDSSDMLPPLKAVMVALSVLIKNYDVGHTPAFCPIHP